VQLDTYQVFAKGLKIVKIKEKKHPKIEIK